MKIINKIGLFLSAFAPLFLLIFIKVLVEIINNNWTLNFLNVLMLIITASSIIFGGIILHKTVDQLKNDKFIKCKILSKQNSTDEHFLGYFSLFVLFAVSFEIEMYSMAIIFFVILALIGIVYIKNDMFYINPLLNIFGYSFYQIKCQDKNDQIVTVNAFFKGRLIVDKEYNLRVLYSNFIFLEDNSKKINFK